MFLLCICSCLWVPFITQCYDVTSLVRHLYVCVVGKNFKKYQGTSLYYIDVRRVYESRLCCKAACFRDDRCIGFYYRRGNCLMSHTPEIKHIQQRDIGNAIMKSTVFDSVIVYNISFITAPGKYDCISHVILPICIVGQSYASYCSSFDSKFITKSFIQEFCLMTGISLCGPESLCLNR